MANLGSDGDWNKKRQQAQPFINKIRSCMEKKTKWCEQIGFLRRCQKEGLVPNGLRVKLPVNIMKSEYGARLKKRSEKRVLKRAVSDLFVKVSRMDKKMAEQRVYLKQTFGFSEAWVKKTENWVRNSLNELVVKLKASLEKKLKVLRAQKRDSKLSQKETNGGVKRKVVYNNSSKKLTEEQMELLGLGLNFGLAPRKFPLVEYVTATEALCQRLEECGDAKLVEKTRAIRNEVFAHLKRGYKFILKSNLSKMQRRVLQELKEDESIIICPADKGKAVVV